MNVKRYVIAVIAVFIFVFLYEYLLHGMLLTDLYEQTKNLWRPENEHNMAFIIASQLGFAIMMTYIFTCNYEAKGIGEGVRYGLYIGLLLGAIDLGTYCYMPIPLTLTLSWVGGSIVKGLGSGVVLALTYKK